MTIVTPSQVKLSKIVDSSNRNKLAEKAESSGVLLSPVEATKMLVKPVGQFETMYLIYASFLPLFNSLTAHNFRAFFLSPKYPTLN